MLCSFISILLDFVVPLLLLAAWPGDTGPVIATALATGTTEAATAVPVATGGTIAIATVVCKVGDTSAKGGSSGNAEKKLLWEDSTDYTTRHCIFVALCTSGSQQLSLPMLVRPFLLVIVVLQVEDPTTTQDQLNTYPLAYLLSTSAGCLIEAATKVSCCL